MRRAHSSCAPNSIVYTKCRNLCGQRGRKRFIASWGLRMSHICPCTPCPSPKRYRSKVESRHFAHHWAKVCLKRPALAVSHAPCSQSINIYRSRPSLSTSFLIPNVHVQVHELHINRIMVSRPKYAVSLAIPVSHSTPAGRPSPVPALLVHLWLGRPK